jgi:hypothetical protein
MRFPRLLLILLALAVASCDSDGLETIPDADRTIELHFQSYFTGQRAVVEINGYRVFEGRLTTSGDFSGGFAEIAEVAVTEGTQEVRVIVNGYAATATFAVGDEPIYVGIRYQAPIDDPVVEFIGVRVEVSNEPYLYY